MRRLLLVSLCAAGALISPVVMSAQQRAAELHVLPIRGNVSMIVGGGSNVTVSAGVDGVLLVDTGAAASADAMLAKVNEIGLAAGAPARMTTCVGPSPWHRNLLLGSSAATLSMTSRPSSRKLPPKWRSSSFMPRRSCI